FFFQAEDGIRDLIVTGVQTCALPISSLARPASPIPPQLKLPLNNCRQTRVPSSSRGLAAQAVTGAWGVGGQPFSGEKVGGFAYRSEERRVGKECSSWCWSCL